MADGRNVTVFGDVSDKFDALVAYNEKLLDNWVAEEGYSTGSMVAASTAMAFMTFAKGFVDLGRIGNGILVEGGLKGLGKDVLRALNFAGGAGAIIGRGAKLLRLVQGTNTCSWFAQTNAVRLAGQRFFLPVEELARRAGVNLAQIAQTGSGGAAYQSMVAALQAMGIPVRTLSNGAGLTLAGVLNLVRANAGGVVTFSIRHAGGGHRLYATWSRLGGLVIRNPARQFEIFRSLGDLVARYGQNVAANAQPVLFIPNALITTLADGAQVVGGLAGLALQVLPIITVSAADGETAVQTLTVHEQVSSEQKPPAGKQPPGKPLADKVHTVAPGDWLSKLARHYYGNINKWPVIYAANTRTIGRNPDLIKPGQKLVIPDLPGCRIIAAAAVPGFARAVA